jgi:hypothetical protein
MFKLPAFVLALSLLPTLTLAQGQEVETYDDTRRMTCVQTSNAFGQEHPEINEASLSYFLDLQTQVLSLNPNGTVVKQGFPDGDTTQVFRDACDTAGGIFVVFTGALDCYTKYNKTSVSIFENSASCFPPGPECEHYTEGPNGASDWQLDIMKVFEELCTVREGSLNNIEAVLPPSSTPMPSGKPNFDRSDPDYSSSRRSQCMDAFTETMNLFGGDDDGEDDTPLNKARFHQAGKTHIETIQMSPILTQREWYPGDDSNYYKQLCEDSGGNFDVFTGVMDCIVLKTGVKTTTVVEDAATCFPGTGCEGYTLARWTQDTMQKLGQSCTIRSVPSPSETSANTGDAEPPPSPPELKEPNSTEKDSKTPMIGVLVVAFTVVVIAVAIVAVRRRKEQDGRILEEARQDLGLSYSDDHPSTSASGVELPSVA